MHWLHTKYSTFLSSPSYTYKNYGFEEHDNGKMKNISVIGITELTMEAIPKFLLTQDNLHNIAMKETVYKTRDLVKNVLK